MTNLKNYFKQEKENFKGSEMHLESILNKISAEKEISQGLTLRKSYASYFYIIPAFATAAFLFSFSFIFKEDELQKLDISRELKAAENFAAAQDGQMYAATSFDSQGSMGVQAKFSAPKIAIEPASTNANSVSATQMNFQATSRSQVVTATEEDYKSETLSLIDNAAPYQEEIYEEI